jgi:hypothetical protein
MEIDIEIEKISFDRKKERNKILYIDTILLYIYLFI